MRARKRQRWFNIASLAIGLGGLTVLIIACRHQPWLRQGLIYYLIWQVFWWIVRIGLTIGVWRRESALASGQKLWLGLTCPLPGLFAVYLGRGKLSAWLTDAGKDAPDDQAGSTAEDDPRAGPEDRPAG